MNNIYHQFKADRRRRKMLRNCLNIMTASDLMQGCVSATIYIKNRVENEKQSIVFALLVLKSLAHSVNQPKYKIETL